MEGLLPPQVMFRLQGLQPAGADARLTLEGETKPSFRGSPRGSFPKLPTGLASKLLQGPGLRLVCPETKKEAGRQALIHPTGVHEAPTCPRLTPPNSPGPGIARPSPAAPSSFPPSPQVSAPRSPSQEGYPLPCSASPALLSCLSLFLSPSTAG